VEFPGVNVEDISGCSVIGFVPDGDGESTAQNPQDLHLFLPVVGHVDSAVFILHFIYF
jgi:hypothetical protein